MRSKVRPLCAYTQNVDVYTHELVNSGRVELCFIAAPATPNSVGARPGSRNDAMDSRNAVRMNFYSYCTFIAYSTERYVTNNVVNTTQ